MKTMYQNDRLVITIPDSCPEAFHAGLMKGVVSALRHQMHSTDDPISRDVMEGNCHLLKFLDALIPKEDQLVKGQR